MNGTPALHARFRKNHVVVVPDEEGQVLSLSQRMSETSHNNNHHHHNHHHQQQQQSILSSPLPPSLPITAATTTTMSKRSSVSSSGSKRSLITKQSVKAEIRMTYVVVSVFILIGIVFAYLLLLHQHRKVIVHVIRNPWAHGRAAFHHITSSSSSSHSNDNRHIHKNNGRNGFHHHFYSGNPKFVTVVLPSVVNPNGRPQRLETIHDTWGPFARAIYVIHNMNEFAKASHLTTSVIQNPYDRYSYPQNLLLPESINIDQGISRLYYTIQTIYERVNPDFAFFVNDHTYVIPAHLCHYLDENNIHPDMDVYAGHALKNEKLAIFNSGAAGYILSRATMKQLIHKFNDHSDKHCWVDPSAANRKWLEGNPGLVITDCLRSMGITAIDTRKGNKYHRFHAFPLVRTVKGDVDTWYINKHQFDELPNTLRSGFDATYSTLLVGTDCCSTDSISFHYVEAMECKALYTVQQTLLDNPNMMDTELQQLIEQNWPTDAHDIGSYSRHLPKSSNQDEWAKLLQTIRNISTKETQTDC